MAKVTPYGDKQAHGTIGKTITFRRYRGDVILQKKPHPHQPDSPGQLQWRQKFKDAWKSYHTLTGWLLDYLEEKAAELNTTKANLYISLYLLDQIPSSIPQNITEEITDLSIPEPIADIPHGLKVSLVARTKDGAIQDPLGQIYDNENIYENIQGKEVYTQLLIKIENLTINIIIIPAGYSCIINSTTHAEEEVIDLVKLPYYEIGPTTEPSRTAMTNVQDITAITIDNLLGTPTSTVVLNTIKFVTDGSFYFLDATGPSDYAVVLMYVIDDPSSQDMLFSIFDNANTPNEKPEPPAYDRALLRFTNFSDDPWTVPAHYGLWIQWTDGADVTHINQIKLPEVTIPANDHIDYYLSEDFSLYSDQALTNLVMNNSGAESNELNFIFKAKKADHGAGTPSTTVLNNIKIVPDGSMYLLDGTGVSDYWIAIIATIDAPASDDTLFTIFDTANIPNTKPERPAYDRCSIRIVNGTDDPWTVPAGYGLWIKWIDNNDFWHIQQIKVPEEIIPANNHVEYWLSDDFCLYEEKELTNLVINNTSDIPVAGIQDWENIMRPFRTDTPQEGFYLEITHPYSPSIFIPKDYSFTLTWTPPGGPPEEIVLKLPKLEIGNTGIPSTKVQNQVKKVTSASLLFTVGTGTGDYDIEIRARTDDPAGNNGLLSISDNANEPTLWPQPPLYDRCTIRIRNNTNNPWTIPSDYGIKIQWENYDSIIRTQIIKLPEVEIPQGETFEYWLSDDFCLYEEKELTTLAFDNTIEPVVIWFASDWSTYEGEVLEELLHSFLEAPLLLYLAEDYSLYWDKELTELASTPFY